MATMRRTGDCGNFNAVPTFHAILRSLDSRLYGTSGRHRRRIVIPTFQYNRSAIGLIVFGVRRIDTTYIYRQMSDRFQSYVQKMRLTKCWPFTSPDRFPNSADIFGESISPSCAREAGRAGGQ